MSKATLEMPSGTLTGEGETIYDALQALPVDYTTIKYKGTLRVEKDGKKFERLFYLPALRRLFAGKLHKQAYASQIDKLLK